MYCKYHKQLISTNNCNVCQSPICEHCVLNINGKIYCKDCLKNKYDQENKNYIVPNEHKYPSTLVSNNVKSSLLYLINFIPGCLPLFLGDKSGLKYLILFFIFININLEIFGVIVFLYSFYYGLAVKRKYDKSKNINNCYLSPKVCKDLMFNDNPNNFIFMVSSLIPGCAHLYLGLNKKGLRLLILFFVFGIFLSFKSFAIITFLYSLCDSLYLKNNFSTYKMINDII